MVVLQQAFINRHYIEANNDCDVSFSAVGVYVLSFGATVECGITARALIDGI
uniref:Pept_C1 domain-containing protein n=1 Tax=Heterorhabditis bacteriophora TaxID=37862 RepID=A0A1I7WP66_HETBA